jgi:hypothetical protein
VADSYSLREVAELMGVSVDAVVRQVGRGDFPGRFLTAELEMRIPVGDVRRALEARVSQTASQMAEPQSPRTARAEMGGELDGLRRVIEDQGRSIRELVEQVVELRSAVDGLRSAVEEGSSGTPWMESEPVSMLEAGSEVDVEGLLQEVSELEAMLGLADGRA